MALRTTLLCTLAIAVAAGCAGKKDGDKDPAKTGPVVARVGTEVITADEVKQRLSEQSPFLQARYRDLAHRKEFVQNLVRSEILAQEAHRRGLDKLPEVRNTMKKILVQELIRREFDEKQASFTEDELKAYYDKHVDEFVKPERVRAQHIFLPGPTEQKAERAKAKAKAAEILAKLKANEAMAPLTAPKHAQYVPTLFADLARENSADEATKAAGGDLRYLSREDLGRQYSPAFADAVFALQNPNDLSGVIETPAGYHVARLTARQQAVNRLFEDDQVKTTIKGRLFREQKTRAFDEYVEKLKKEANVQIDEAVLNGIEVTPPSTGQGPFGMPGMMPPPGAPTPAPAMAKPPAPAPGK